MNKLWIFLIGIALTTVACENKQSLKSGAPAIRALKASADELSPAQNILAFSELKRGGLQTRTLRFHAPVAGELRLKLALHGLGVNCAAKSKYTENYVVRYTYVTRDAKTGLFTAEVKPAVEALSDVQPHFALAVGEELQILVELSSMCTCESAEVRIAATFVP